MIFKSKKYWIIAACLWAPWAVIMFAGYNFILRPQMEEYRSVHKQFTLSNDEVSLGKFAALQTTKQQQLKQLEELNAAVRQYLVQDLEEDRMVFEISRLASELNLSEYAGKTRHDVWGYEPDEKITVRRVWMSIKFRAAFEQLAAFINTLERHSPAVYINDIKLERPENGRPQVQVLISFFTRSESDSKSGSVAANTPRQDKEPVL